MTTEDGTTDHLDQPAETTEAAPPAPADAVEALPDDPDAETQAQQQLRQRQIAQAAAEQLAANAAHAATLPPPWINQSALAWYAEGTDEEHLPKGVDFASFTASMWHALTGAPRPDPTLEVESWDGGDAVYRLFPALDEDKAPPATKGMRPIAVDFKDGRAGISLIRT